MNWVAAGAIGAGAAGAVLAHSVFIAPKSVGLRRREIVLPRLPAAFDGYEILHVSDLHIGSPSGGAEQLALAAGMHADLAVCTGDLLEYERFAGACARLLGLLSARDGVVCIPGNHDNKAIRRAKGSTALWATIRDHGIRPLFNESIPLERDGERLWIVGVDDPYEGRSDVARAFADVPAGEPAVLLAHSPDIASSLPPGKADLVLTGHCHGGQVRTPWGPVFTRTRRHFPDVLGLQTIDGTLYHMSAGLGSSIPLRFLCPPEATVLRLRRAP
jgi:predicted MPP superfamily phosphohydrolase